MLAGAHRLKGEGRDVVVGAAETHGRAETNALLQGLEVLPRRAVSYHGVVLQEFDLDAALMRRPQLIIVDELAHSNPAEARHPKRYQDVEELLAAGIDVWTALNIQHIESLSDVVSSITGIAVREVVPDTVLENADDVVLVDITPDELIQRLKDGKIYLPATAQRAADNFLQAGNLTALRELALRRTAQRVDDEMVDYLRQRAIEGPWPTAERIMVCVGSDALSEKVVRAAARLANGLNAPWLAVHLARPAEAAGDPDHLKRIDDSLALATRLGAQILRHTAFDIANEALRIAQRENITQIVVGRSKPGWLKTALGRSLPDALLRRSNGLAIHVISDEGVRTHAPWRWPKIPQPALFAALVSVAAAIPVAVGINQLLPLSNLSMVFLTAVLFCAVRFGTWSATIASVLSFLAYNFFFIPPRYTLTIASPQELLSLFVFLLVAIFTGSLTGRVRGQSVAALARVKQIQSLLDFSGKLSATVKSDDVLWAIATHAASTVEGQSIILLRRGEGDLQILAAMPPEDDLGTSDWAAARWAADHGDTAGWNTGTLPSAHFLFLPLRTPYAVIGCIGVRPGSGKLSDETRRLVDGLVGQSSVALERTRLVSEAADARTTAEAEKLRATLLSSISHDFRTPLASIVGSISALRSLGAKMPAEDREDLLANIEEEAQHLSRFVTNLLDMTKFEGGAVQPRHDAIDAVEVAMAVVRRAKAIWPDRVFQTRWGSNAMPMQSDASLLEQLMFNLVENACKYTPIDTPITVAASQNLDRVILTVEDQGTGIPPEELERVFEKFHRVAPGDGRPSGTGLGLAICKAIAASLGGTIHAESPAAAGHGARFVVNLPVGT